MLLVALRTTAFERMEANGWTIADLAERSGLSEEMLYKLRAGRRGPGPKVIEGLLRAFPNLGYGDLFVRTESTVVRRESSSVQEAAAA